MFLTVRQLKECVREILIEKRREGKTDRYQQAVDTLEKYVDKGLFFHMTDDPLKYGININTEHDTPLGVYCYPLTSEMFSDLLNGKLPFAINRQYVTVYKNSGILVKTSEYSETKLYKDARKFGYKNKDIETIYLQKSKVNNNSVSALLYILYDGDFKHKKAQASKRLLQLGYVGIYDDLGLGVIHENEPLQAFFVDVSKLSVVTTARNPLTVRIHIYKILNSDDDELTQKMFNTLSEDEINYLLSKDGTLIRFIKNPSKKQIDIAINNTYYALQYVKNPSEKLVLSVVSDYPNAIKFIKNPSEEIQLTAVNNNAYAIYNIKNPSERVQLVVVEKDPNFMGSLQNPTERVQLTALKQDPGIFYMIRNPTQAAIDYYDKVVHL